MKLEQKVGLSQMFTSDSFNNKFTVHLCFLFQISLANQVVETCLVIPLLMSQPYLACGE